MLDLFGSIRLGAWMLPSRILLAPINTGYCRSGAPTDGLLNFHKLRSGPGIGVSMVGNVSVVQDGRSNPQTLVLDGESVVRRFAALSRTISENGSLPGIQLAYCPVGLEAGRRWLTDDPAAERDRLRRLVASLPKETLNAALRSFVTATGLAHSAGFRVVQIHAAHGYLLSLLLSPVTNKRSDEFRIVGPWLSAFLERLHAVGGGNALSLRLSLFSGLATDISEETSYMLDLARQLTDGGVHLLDYSAGFYTVNKWLIYPREDTGQLPYLGFAARIAREVKAVVGCAGNVTDLRTVPALLPNMVLSAGRALIADPGFVEKSRIGAFDDILRCQRVGHCHYFSRGRVKLECGVNPQLARLA